MEAASGYLSGAEISRRVGRSRAAVWQWIEELRRDGYTIEASPRRGYRLVARPDRLYPWEVQRHLRTERIGRRIVYQERVDSTNDWVRALAKEGAPEGLVAVAEEQLKGRGRRGRTWSSPFAKGVWSTTLLRPAIPPQAAPTMALAAALAVARAVEEVTGLAAAVKWPNDVLVGEKKVAGILVEMDAELDQVRSLAVGIGLNANLEPDDFPPEARSHATSLLLALGRPVDRAALLGALLNHLERVYLRVLEGGLGAVLDDLRKRAAWLGFEVQVTDGQRAWEGVARDIAPDGALLVETAGGRLERVYAADVSVRAAR